MHEGHSSIPEWFIGFDPEPATTAFECQMYAFAEADTPMEGSAVFNSSGHARAAVSTLVDDLVAKQTALERMQASIGMFWVGLVMLRLQRVCSGVYMLGARDFNGI